MRTVIIALATVLAASQAWAAAGCEWHEGDDFWACPGIIAPNHSPREDRSWHLLTQSYGGTVSLLRDLTKQECEVARAKLMPELIIPEGLTGTILYNVPGDIRSAECFQ